MFRFFFLIIRNIKKKTILPRDKAKKLGISCQTAKNRRQSFKKYLLELGERFIMYTGTKMRIIEDFLSEANQARSPWSNILKVLK